MSRRWPCAVSYSFFISHLILNDIMRHNSECSGDSVKELEIGEAFLSSIRTSRMTNSIFELESIRPSINQLELTQL